jgi:hypothetical protein
MSVIVPLHIYKMAQFRTRMNASEVEKANRYLRQFRREPDEGVVVEAPQGYAWGVVDGRNQLVSE